MNEAQISPFDVEDALIVMDSTPEQVPCLAEDLLLKVGTSMLTAKPKVGKSTFARQLSVAVAEGRSFFGHETHMGDVLYFVLEGPKGAVGHHLKKLGYTGTRRKIHIVHERMPYKGDLGLMKLEATLALPRMSDVCLVVIDPIKKLLRLADSDKDDEVSLAIEKVEAVAKKFNVHILFLAHAKKRQTDDTGDSSIGSTGFRGGTDTNMYLMKKGRDRIFETEQRWGVGIEPTLVIFDEEHGEMSLGQLVEDVAESARERKSRDIRERIEAEVWALLKTTPSPSQKDILAGVQGKNTTILEVLASMCQRKFLSKSVVADVTRYVLYEEQVSRNEVVNRDPAEVA